METSFLTLLQQTKVAAIYYNDSIEISQKAMQACYDGGIRIFEWVTKGKYAVAHFTELQSFSKIYCLEMVIGAGSVLAEKTAEQFIDLGAQFLTSPTFNIDVLDKAYYAKTIYMPSCFTPTEINKAYDAGCTWVRIFPAEVVGSQFIKAVKTVMPDVKMMVAGGIQPNKENIDEWLSSGAEAVGIGKQLFENADPEVIKYRVKNCMPN